VANAGYPHGAPVVFLASGENFPDALAAGPAAAKLKGPLLLTAPDSLPASVAAELKALAPSQVYLVGGTTAVGSGVQNAVRKALPAASVTRLQGKDRYETSRAVVSTVFSSASNAFIATGTGFADALSAAAAAGAQGAPVVLVNGSAKALDTATVAELKKLGVKDVTIAGGPSAVSAGVQSGLNSMLGASHVTRVGGVDRYATSAMIGASFSSATTAYFASGVQFPDALAASAVAAAQHAPLFTVLPTRVPNATYSAMTALGVSSVVVIGGTSALSPDVQALKTVSPVSIPAPKAFTTAPTPTISGTVAVGQTLTAAAGTWSPAPTLSYQWSRAASASSTFTVIAGATSSSYVVASGDAGYKLKVTVTGSKPGYTTTSRSSAATAVVPTPVAPNAAQLSVIAGIGTAPKPGPALSSPMGYPVATAVDASGDVYVADNHNFVVEKVSASGQLSVFAGNGTYGDPVPGPATSSPLDAPAQLAVDGDGNVFIASGNHVEKVTPSGQLTVVAGNDSYDEQPTVGPALDSSISPAGIAVSSTGDIYIGDASRHVLKVTAAGQLSIMAGNGTDGAPQAGTATASPLGTIADVALDGAGNLYIGDLGNQEIEKVTPGGELSVFAGGGSSDAASEEPANEAEIYPSGLAADAAGDVFVADGASVMKVTQSGDLSIVAGSGADPASTAGPTPDAAIMPGDVALDSDGNLYVADGPNSLVEKISTAGQLSFIAGVGLAGKPGPALSSPLPSSEVGIAVDSVGNVYIPDLYHYQLDKISPAGVLSVVAGNGSFGAPQPGPATESPLGEVSSVAIDAADNLYIADRDVVEKVTPDGELSIAASLADVSYAGSSLNVMGGEIAVDGSGNLYIGDEYDGYVLKAAPNGSVSVVAGDGVSDTPTPGPATSSAIGWIADLAVDSAGNLYIADQNSGYIEKVTPSGQLSLFAGEGRDGVNDGGLTDGPADERSLNPLSIAIDSSDDVYVGDGPGHIVRITQDGQLTVVAGNGTWNAPTPGPAMQSSVGRDSIAIGSEGTLYAFDQSQGYIEKITQG